jgi:hypothetical protein
MSAPYKVEPHGDLTSQQLRDLAVSKEMPRQDLESGAQGLAALGRNALRRINELEETLHHERGYHAKQIAALKTEMGRVKRQLDVQTERAIRAEEIGK